MMGLDFEREGLDQGPRDLKDLLGVRDRDLGIKG